MSLFNILLMVCLAICLVNHAMIRNMRRQIATQRAAIESNRASIRRVANDQKIIKLFGELELFRSKVIKRLDELRDEEERTIDIENLLSAATQVAQLERNPDKLSALNQHISVAQRVIKHIDQSIERTRILLNVPVDIPVNRIVLSQAKWAVDMPLL